MPKTSFTSYVRSYMGYGKGATPAALDGHMQFKVDCGLTTKQIVARLPRHARIAEVRRIPLPVVGGPGYVAGSAEAAAGTFTMDLEAVTTPTLAGVNVVAGGATAAVGTKTVVAASLLIPFQVERDLSVTWTGGTAGQVAWFAVMLIPSDHGREGS